MQPAAAAAPVATSAADANAANVATASAAPIDNMAQPAAGALTPQPAYAPQVGMPSMQPMHPPQGVGMFQPMHAQATHAQSVAGRMGSAGLQMQQQPGMGASAGGSMAALAPGVVRPTQHSFMHTSGELARGKSKDAFDFVNDAIRK